MRKDSMKSVEVTPDNELIFYNYIKDNFAEYFFFYVDYAQYPEDTKIYMVLDNRTKIHGMLLNSKDRRIQLRGSLESLELLLKDNNFKPISVTGFEEHKGIITKYFPEYTNETAIYLMGLKKGEQKNFEKYPYNILSDAYREEIVSFMNMCDPEYWGSVKPEDILIDDNNIQIAIIENNRLICLTRIWKYENIGYFIIVGTHPEYRNKGYASSLISSLLNGLLVDKKECLITVRVNNPPALHTYKKMGFSIRNTQYSYERPT